jgi:phage-related protein
MSMYDVRVNAVSVRSIGVALFERRLPILPSERGNTLELAGRDGSLDFGGGYGARSLGLTFEIVAAPADYHGTLARLARMFHARRGELTLEFSDMPGKYYRAVYAGTLSLNAQTGSRLVDVELRMNDPWPSSGEVVTEFTITADPQSVIITSAADVPAEPLITLTNTGSNVIRGFTITNEYPID